MLSDTHALKKGPLAWRALLCPSWVAACCFFPGVATVPTLVINIPQLCVCVFNHVSIFECLYTSHILSDLWLGFPFSL